MLEIIQFCIYYKWLNRKLVTVAEKNHWNTCQYKHQAEKNENLQTVKSSTRLKADF